MDNVGEWNRMADGKWIENWSFDNAELMNAQNNNTILFQGYPFTEFTEFEHQENHRDFSSKEDGSPSHTSSSDYVCINPAMLADEKDKEEILKRLDVLEGENQKMKRQLKRLNTRIEVAEENIEDHHDYIYFLEKNLARLDQYGRRENIEIAGIPSNVADKHLESEVLRILRQIGLKHLEHFHIVACHRIGSLDKNGNKNTIVRFINRKDAILCLKNKKNLHLCKYLGYNNLYIMENLCPAYRSIFDSLTKLKNEDRVKKVWSYNGIINYKVTDDVNEKAVKVLHECELENLYIDSSGM